MITASRKNRISIKKLVETSVGCDGEKKNEQIDFVQASMISLRTCSTDLTKIHIH